MPLAHPLRAAVAVAACLLPMAGAAPAVAVPADRAAAASAYAQVQADGKVAAGWTGATATCTVGTESQASTDATLRTLNTLRDFAGLQPVTFEATRNAHALAAALMMKAQNSLSHNPGADWACSSPDGYDGASHSNLYLGASGARAMVGYVDDGGVGSLGHRYWVLDPSAATFGSGSTGTTNALYVVGSAPTATPQSSLVAWPPKGTWVPGSWVFADWSLEAPRPGPGQPTPDFSAAQVAVSVGGAPAAVTGVTNLGSGRLKWLVAGKFDAFATDTRVDVTVSGATLNGAPYPVAYSTTILGTAAPTPVPTPVPTPQPTPTPAASVATTPDPPATDRKVQTVGTVTASIRVGTATRGRKVTVSVGGAAAGARIRLVWEARGASAKRCRAAARNATKTVGVSDGKARTTAPRCRGTYRLSAHLGRTELIRRSFRVR